MEINVTLKADERLINAIEALTQVLTGNALGSVVSNTVSTNVPNTTVNVETDKVSAPNVATKKMYFMHDESDTAVLVEKGESLDDVEKQGLTPITKAQYDKWKAEYDARMERMTASAEPPAEESDEAKPAQTEGETSEITLEMIRAEAQKLLSNGKQAQMKEIFAQFHDESGEPCKKLSSIKNADYASFFETVQKAVVEAGVK